MELWQIYGLLALCVAAVVLAIIIDEWRGPRKPMP